VTEALITELAKFKRLRVVSRTSVMRYRGTGERIAQIARALRVQAVVEGSLMRSLYYARRFEEAATQFKKALELESRWDQLYFGLGLTLAQTPRRDEAVAALREAVTLGPENPLNQALLVYVLGRAGRAREAAQEMEQLSARHAYCPSWFLSIVWIGLNDHRRAFECLEDAFRGREPCLVSLKVDPVFDPIRRDPAFAGMVRRIGLEP
jgi:tetratricopeptide (TPR) repeat protein